MEGAKKAIWPGRVGMEQPPVLVVTLDQGSRRDRIKWDKVQLMGW